MPRKMHEGKARPKSSVTANTAPHGGEAPVIKGKGRAVQAPQRATGSGEVLNFEAKLWSMADQLRGSMDASEYKHPVLGLIFLKYISDAFEELHAELASDPESDAEDRDEYTARNVFWVPAAARWSQIAASAKSPQIGEIVDAAMIEIERDNPRLKGVLPKEYAKPSLGSTRLGAIVDLVNGIGLGNAEARKHDVIGRVYEYFLGRFANAEGKAGGEFYTPRPVVRLLVEAIEPYKGRVFDPCCGSGGMFVQSEQFVLAHGGKIGDVSIYGQESNHTTWRLAMMNLAIRGIEAHIEWNEGGSFLQDAFPDLKADLFSQIRPLTTANGAARDCATTSAGSSVFRRRETRTTRGSSTSFITSRRPASRRSLWRTVRCRRTKAARVRFAGTLSKRSTAGSSIA